MADPLARLAEDLQRIAEICGEFSLGGCGIIQHRATFSAWGGHPPQIVAVPPEKVEGIYEAIWLRLRQRPEYRPLEDARSDATRAWAEARRWRAKAEAAERYIATLTAELRPTDHDPPLPETRARVSEQARRAWEKLP